MEISSRPSHRILPRLALLTALAGTLAGCVSTVRTDPGFRFAQSRNMPMADAAPRVRLRADPTGKGLTEQGFARWISRNAALVQPWRQDAPQRMLARAPSPTETTRRNFDAADRNGDGRVSAEELADFITLRPDAKALTAL